MQLERLGIILALFIMSSCISLGQTQSESATGIEGVIAISPTLPRMTREAVSTPAPFVNAPFKIANENGVVASFTTDDQGRFRVLAAPGRYTVSQQDNKSGLRRCGPWGNVDVVAGKMTKVEWYCEMTGARL